MENKLHTWFYTKKHKMKCYKWIHYLDIYEKHFAKFSRRKRISILEIGVYDGGSLEMWDNYFNRAKIVGVDINKECLKLQKNFGENVIIELGDQARPDFWEDFKKRHEPFDIIIDDGGHMMNQQLTTFECMYDHVKENGVYLVEDTHTSYYNNFGGGLNRPETFIEKTKAFIDAMHVHHFKKDIPKDKRWIDFHSKTQSVTYYDSVVVFDKKKQNLPEAKKL